VLANAVRAFCVAVSDGHEWLRAASHARGCGPLAPCLVASVQLAARHADRRAVMRSER